MPIDATAAYDDTNIFAKILRGEIPCRKVYEDDFALAFHDIAPQAPVHILVIPKGRYVSWDDFSREASDPEVCGFIRAVGHVAREAGLPVPGYRLLANIGGHGHQEVAHLHVHIFGGRPLGAMLAHANAHESALLSRVNGNAMMDESTMRSILMEIGPGFSVMTEYDRTRLGADLTARVVFYVDDHPIGNIDLSAAHPDVKVPNYGANGAYRDLVIEDGATVALVQPSERNAEPNVSLRMRWTLDHLSMTYDGVIARLVSW